MFEKISKKYGEPVKMSNFYYQGIVKHIKGQYLNAYFMPVDIKNYEKAENFLKWEMPNELREFYSRYNGIMLFCESLRIFGYKEDDKIHDIDPTSLISGNLRAKFSIFMPQYKDMIVFGSAGYYYFCYKRNYDGKIYVIGSREKSVIKTYNTLKELLNYYIDYYVDEYDENGKKIHIEKNSRGSIYENITYEFI